METSRISNFFRLLPAFVLGVLLTGCANQLTSTRSPAYVGKITHVSSIAVTGDGSSIAASAFIAHGYDVKDIGTASADPLGLAQSQDIPFLASIDRVGTDEAVWDGFFKYSMRVTNTRTRSIVWSANGKYGEGGVFINQVKSNKDAMNAMVQDFSTNFPPKK
jgi:hypothetical protein